MYTAFRGCVPRRVYTPWDVVVYRLTEPLPAFLFDFFVLALFWIWNKALNHNQRQQEQSGLPDAPQYHNPAPLK